jgi:broad specificity phosphatase PhoE
MYGDLEGKSKPQTCVELGEEEVQKYRRGLYARPPPMTPGHPNWHGTEKKYQDLDPSEIPLSESLLDTMQRTSPLLETRIIPDILAGKTVMVVAHANSLRGVVKHIDNLSAEQITEVGIPNGIPLVYKFNVDGGRLVPIPQPMAVEPLTGEFLEKKVNSTVIRRDATSTSPLQKYGYRRRIKSIITLLPFSTPFPLCFEAEYPVLSYELLSSSIKRENTCCCLIFE